MRFFNWLLPPLATGLATQASTPTLQQPTCDDTQPGALSIFHLASQSGKCVAALDTYTASLSSARNQYRLFAAQAADFEANYDRLCRWQRLEKQPPPMTCKHVGQFEKLKIRFEDLDQAETASRAGLQTVLDVCGRIGVGMDSSLGVMERHVGVWPEIDCAAERQQALVEMGK